MPACTGAPSPPLQALVWIRTHALLFRLLLQPALVATRSCKVLGAAVSRVALFLRELRVMGLRATESVVVLATMVLWLDFALFLRASGA